VNEGSLLSLHRFTGSPFRVHPAGPMLQFESLTPTEELSKGGCPERGRQSSCCGYAQQPAVLGAGAEDLCNEHPQPVPPLDFTVASWAQHPLRPAGAGPPQQLVGCVFRDSPELVVVWLLLMALSSLCGLAARAHFQWTETSVEGRIRPASRTLVLAHASFLAAARL